MPNPPVPATAEGLPGVLIHPREQLRRLRARMAEAVERLLEVIDAIDGDPDMEPSLGSVYQPSIWYPDVPWAQGVTDDREADGDDLEFTGDENEPSLGAPENPRSQLDWARGEGENREEECEDEGAQCDDEGVDTDSEPDESPFVSAHPFEMDQTDGRAVRTHPADRVRLQEEAKANWPLPEAPTKPRPARIAMRPSKHGRNICHIKRHEGPKGPGPNR